LREAAVLLAQEHMEASIREENPGRWGFWTEKMRAAIPQLNTPLEVLNYAQTKLPFTHLEACAFDLLYSANTILGFEFPWLSAKQNEAYEPVGSANVWSDRRRSVSNMMLWHLRSVFAAQTWCQSTARVAEIGAGYGAFARLWLMADIRPCERYVIIDLPESLFFSEVCLRQQFGDDVGYFPQQSKITLVPVAQLGNFKDDIDLVLNIGSFQEMSPDWVDRYMKWMDTTAAKSFYSLNYCGTPLWRMAETRNYWSPRPSPEWEASLLNDDSALVKLFCKNTNFLEAVYERHPGKRRFREWASNGRVMTRRNYIEGLEALRLEWSEANASEFVTCVMEGWPGDPRGLPKELPAILEEINDQDRLGKLLPLIGGYER
jgi:hypothetical protein